MNNRLKVSVLAFFIIYSQPLFSQESNFSIVTPIITVNRQERKLHYIFPFGTVPFIIKNPTIDVIKVLEKEPGISYQVYFVDNENGLWSSWHFDLTRIKTNYFGQVGNSIPWGKKGDHFHVCDFDGDGQQDYASYRPEIAMWLIRFEKNNLSVSLGKPGSNQQSFTLDFDGDGKCDVGNYVEGIWTWRTISPIGEENLIKYGEPGQIAMPGNFNEDNKIDYGIFDPKTNIWHVLFQNHKNLSDKLGRTIKWGESGDSPITGDYDHDLRTDIAVFRKSSGVMYILNSGSDYTNSVAQKIAPIGFEPEKFYMELGK